MFDRNKQTDEASAASAQGIERKGNDGSLRQESSSSVQGPELGLPGQPVRQNRQGYCNCCHVHYSNLEQHVYSSQHKHFATYCRNRMGTTSLMERFLQDVLRHHPYRYHDSRDESLLSVEMMEKETIRSRREEPSTDSGFTAESGCFISQRSHEELKEASVPITHTKKLERGQECSLGTSQQTMDISSSTRNPVPAEGTLTENTSHKVPVTVVNFLPLPLPASCSPSPPHMFAQSIGYSVIPDLVSYGRCEQINQGTCSQDKLLHHSLHPVVQSPHSRTVSISHESPVCNQGSSLISGQHFLKQDGLQPQDETQISDLCLRDISNPVSTSSPLVFQGASLLSGKKEKLDGSAEVSVDEVIEEVILKYCYETPPKELPDRDEEVSSCKNILSLLDYSSMHGSDMSFECDAAIQSGSLLPEAAIKNLELLKEVQVNLKDENYGTQLSSILENGLVQQLPEAEKDVSAHNNEPVLPALPHVPPSFVGKTWSQIMYEDDMKIEALVRDFREGRFHCHFDTESLSNRARRRLRNKRKDEGRTDMIAVNKTAELSDKGLPEFVADFSSSSINSEVQHVPETSKKPKKRTWRLASRCQVVKVSHGTQTSLVHYPVVKHKVVRKDHELPDQKTNLDWSENEKTPTMKTRLCALKLPESYNKIMSPLQPQTIVYVLSCPEIKQFRNKPEDIPKIRRSHNSTDSKDSVRYKYKQNSVKYYDPLTNRVLKTPPKNLPGEKRKKPPHVRQLFRNLNLDANKKKQSDAHCECVAPKFFSSPDSHSSSTSCLLSTVKDSDINPGHRVDGSFLSTEKSECLTCNTSEKCYKHLVLSPLNPNPSHLDSDIKLSQFNKEMKPPLKSCGNDCLERGNLKTMWQRRKGSSRELGFSKKASGPAIVRHNLVRRGSRKQPPRITTQRKEGRKRNASCTLKSTALSIPRHQAKRTAVGKHLNKEKNNPKKHKVTRKPKRTFLNTATIMGVGIPEKRQRATSRASSKVKKWEVTGEKNLHYTVK